MQNRNRANAWYVANPERAKAYRENTRLERSQYNRRYYERNVDAERTRARSWQIANPDKVAANRKRDKESGKANERAKRHREHFPDRVRASNRRFYAKNLLQSRARVLQWAKDNPDKARALNSRNNRRRKAVVRGARDVERFDAVEIYERDGWICQICGDVIDPTVKYPNVRSASLDHVLPISKGGQHLKSNVQTAHFSCNAGKGNRVISPE